MQAERTLGKLTRGGMGGGLVALAVSRAWAAVGGQKTHIIAREVPWALLRRPSAESIAARVDMEFEAPVTLSLSLGRLRSGPLQSSPCC